VNGWTDGGNDEGHASGADYIPVETYSEAIVADRRAEHSNVDSHDSHLPVEPASASKQELDFETKMLRTRSLETSAVVAERMSSEEAETVSSSEMENGAARASEMEDDAENGTPNEQASDGGHLNRTERRRSSRTRTADNGKDDSSEENPTHNPISTEEYRSQRLTSTEDYRSQKYTDTEDYRSQEISDTGSEQSESTSASTGGS